MVAYESISNLPIVCFSHSADRCNAFQSQFVFIKSQTFLNIRVLRERMKGIRLCREEEKGNVAWQWNLYIGIDATFSGSWGWSRVPFATDEIDGDEKQQKNVINSSPQFSTGDKFFCREGTERIVHDFDDQFANLFRHFRFHFVEHLLRILVQEVVHRFTWDAGRQQMKQVISFKKGITIVSSAALCFH